MRSTLSIVYECYLKNNNYKQGEYTTRDCRNQMKSVNDNNEKSVGSFTTRNCNATDHQSHNLNQFVGCLYFLSVHKNKFDTNNMDARKYKKTCAICLLNLQM